MAKLTDIYSIVRADIQALKKEVAAAKAYKTKIIHHRNALKYELIYYPNTKKYIFSLSIMYFTILSII